MSRDRGSATIAMTALVASIALLAVAVTAIAVLYAARAKAHNAADAAALGAAVATFPAAADDTPLEVARLMAASNGAVLTACDCPVDAHLAPRTVQVTVAVDTRVPIFGQVVVRGHARAEFDPALWLGP